MLACRTSVRHRVGPLLQTKYGHEQKRIKHGQTFRVAPKPLTAKKRTGIMDLVPAQRGIIHSHSGKKTQLCDHTRNQAAGSQMGNSAD